MKKNIAPFLLAAIFMMAGCKNLVVKVNDSSGNALKNAPVILIYDKQYSETTDNDGNITVPIPSPAPTEVRVIAQIGSGVCTGRADVNIFCRPTVNLGVCGGKAAAKAALDQLPLTVFVKDAMQQPVANNTTPIIWFPSKCDPSNGYGFATDANGEDDNVQVAKFCATCSLTVSINGRICIGSAPVSGPPYTTTVTVR